VSAAIGTDAAISLLANAEMGQRLTDRYGKISLGAGRNGYDKVLIHITIRQEIATAAAEMPIPQP
jgi:hypothetical protein